jgi:ATP-dependent Lon protease
MSDQPVVYELPVLPLKNAVLFPYLLMPLSAGRPGSVAAVEAALATESKEVLVFTQRDGDVDSPLQSDLYPIGTKAVIRKMNRSGEGHLELLVLGMERVALVKLDNSEPFLKARVTPLPLPEDKSSEIEALQGALIELAGEALTLAQPNAPQELRGLLSANEDPLRQAGIHVQPGRGKSSGVARISDARRSSPAGASLPDARSASAGTAE